MQLTSHPFGDTEEGDVRKYCLSSGAGLEVDIIDFGGIVTAIRFPDSVGEINDLVLGFDDLSGYLGEHPSFGEIIGRYGNRIGNAKFTLEDTEYHLQANLGPHTLHGGLRGFGRYLWKSKEISLENAVGVEVTRVSPDMEEGFPGNLHVRVRYMVDADNRLTITYLATTDAPTVLNLTNHTYFNLRGHDSGDIFDHELVINASRITAVDDDLIPTGTLQAVAGTPLDFRTRKKIGGGIRAEHPLIRLGHGYDHNFVLDNPGADHCAARVWDAVSGRIMEVFTDEPAVQLYTSNWLDGSLIGKGGFAYQKHAALCLETQHFPDSPNHPEFPSTALYPGDAYRSRTVYAFSIG